VTAADVRRVLLEHPQLHRSGYGAARLFGKVISALTEPPPDLAKSVAAGNWALENLRPARTAYCRNSYGLKHDAERDLGHYVANGDLIAGMLAAGFAMQRPEYNVEFLVRYKKPSVHAGLAPTGTGGAA
jgi:hypothetical protein